MIRIWLSFSVSGLVLVVGVHAACVQSDNFARGAQLHELQLQSDWCLRRATQLRVELEGHRFEFSAPEVVGPDPEGLALDPEGWSPLAGAGQGGTL